MTEILISGAGAIGLAASLAFADQGYSVALVGPLDLRRDGRTVALLDGAIRFLEEIDLWSALQDKASPLRSLRLIDSKNGLFQAPPIIFQADEIGLEAFGWNISNDDLISTLAEKVEATQAISWHRGRTRGFKSEENAVHLTLDDETDLSGKLVVAADGRSSFLRGAARIGATLRSHPQMALTTTLAHDRPHDDVSTEFQTRQGPFTLVPMHHKRSSLVWVAHPDRAKALNDQGDTDLAMAIERQAQSLLGAMRIEGPRGLSPIGSLLADCFFAPRLALVGEAAHVLPPIGAQGLNLGLGDIAALRNATGGHEDPGCERTLQAYSRLRRNDAVLRGLMVEGLNGSLLSSFAPLDAARGVGMALLAQARPLRRFLMRQGVSPSLGAAKWMS